MSLLPSYRTIIVDRAVAKRSKLDNLNCSSLHRVSKNCAKLSSSELRQISTNFDNFWQKDDK